MDAAEYSELAHMQIDEGERAIDGCRFGGGLPCSTDFIALKWIYCSASLASVRHPGTFEEDGVANVGEEKPPPSPWILCEIASVGLKLLFRKGPNLNSSCPLCVAVLQAHPPLSRLRNTPFFILIAALEIIREKRNRQREQASASGRGSAAAESQPALISPTDHSSRYGKKKKNF